jgi:hypothetical protein
VSDLTSDTSTRKPRGKGRKDLELIRLYRQELKKSGGLKVLIAAQVRRALDDANPKGLDAAKDIQDRVYGKPAQQMVLSTPDNQPFPIALIADTNPTKAKK